jgi:hypothetical protein
MPQKNSNCRWLKTTGGHVNIQLRVRFSIDPGHPNFHRMLTRPPYKK